MSVPSVGVGAVVRAPVASHLARGLHSSFGRGRSTPRGSGAPVFRLQGSSEAEVVPDRSWGLGEVKTTTRGACLAQDLSARLGWDGGWLSGLERLTCCQRLLRVGFTEALTMRL
jgi:hypothetical protein